MKSNRRRNILSSGLFTAGFGFMARAANQLSALLLTFVAARNLAPVEFGIFSLAVIAANLIRTILYSGAFEYLLKAPSTEACSREVLAANGIVTAVLTSPTAVCAAVFLLLHPDSEIALILLILLPSTFISAIAAWQEALCLKAGKSKLYYLVTSSAEIFSTLVVIFLFFLGFGLYALVLKTYMASIITVVFYLKTGTTKWESGYQRAKTKEILIWSMERYGAVLMTFGSTYAGDLILGAFLSPAATGIYRGGSRLVTSVADLFNQPTRLLGMTFYSSRAAKNVSSAHTLPLVVAAATCIGWSALVGLAVTSNTVVPLLLGPAWREAVPVVTVLCLARAFSLVDSSISPALVAYNHQRSIFILQLAIVPLLILTLLIASPFGVVMATWAVAGTAAVNTSCLLWYVRWKLRPTASAWQKALPVAVAPTLSTAAGALLVGRLDVIEQSSPNIQLLSQALVAVICWSVMLFILRRQIRRIVEELSTPPTTI